MTITPAHHLTCAPAGKASIDMIVHSDPHRQLGLLGAMHCGSAEPKQSGTQTGRLLQPAPSSPREGSCKRGRTCAW